MSMKLLLLLLVALLAMLGSDDEAEAKTSLSSTDKEGDQSIG